jgi:hypothetical protein
MGQNQCKARPNIESAHRLYHAFLPLSIIGRKKFKSIIFFNEAHACNHNSFCKTKVQILIAYCTWFSRFFRLFIKENTVQVKYEIINGSLFYIYLAKLSKDP